MTDGAGINDVPTVPGTTQHFAMSKASYQSAPGSMIGPYRVLAPLGDGGFGVVYLAEQTHPVRRRVAVKVLKIGMDTPSLVARFEAERQVLVMMDHPGVAKVFDAGVTPEGRPYVVMEYVAGEPISKFCENARLSVDDRVRLMVKVCNAVHHAHMKGVIHRDLKPANILVELVDATPTPRVIDFGVAKALGRPLSDSGVVTEFGQMVGTPEYMPPEQARGAGAGVRGETGESGAVGGMNLDADTRADVYALGAVLYELLTGATPLDSRELRRAGYAEMQRIIEHEVPVMPSRRLTGIRAASGSAPGGEASLPVRRIRREFDWIVMKCLEKDRARRYESAAALARDLDRALSDEPVEAGPPSVSYRTAKFIRRNKIAVGAAAVCLAIGIGAFAITAWALDRAIRERAAAQAEERKAIEARDEAEAVTSFLTGILESVQPENSGRDVTVRQVLDTAAAKLATDGGADGLSSPLLNARVRLTLGASYLALGDLEQAERHLAAGARVREQLLGPDAPLTLRALFNLAGLLHAQGRFDEAKLLYSRCLAAWGGGRTPDTAPIPDAQALGAMNNLAQIAVKEGRLDEAEAMQRRTVVAMEEHLGAAHEHTLGARTNLGAILREQHRLDESERALREAQDAWAAAFGAEHPGTLLAMHNLALVYLDAGRLDSAESIMRRLVEIRSRVLGDRHPDTIASRSNLGLTLSQSNSPEARPLLLEAWEASRRVLGEAHPTTLTTGMSALSRYEQEGWPESGAADVERLIGTLRVIAERPGASASELNACAWMLLTAQPDRLNDPDAALKAATRACDLERRVGGRELWQYLDTLALAYARTGAHQNAVQTQRDAINAMPSTPDAQAYAGEMKQRLAEYERQAAK